MRPVADRESGAQAGRIGHLYSLRNIDVCKRLREKLIDTPGLEGLKSATVFLCN